MLSKWSVVMLLILSLWGTSVGHAMDRERDDFFGYPATYPQGNSLKQEKPLFYEAIEKSQFPSNQGEFYYLSEVLDKEYVYVLRSSSSEEENEVKKETVTSRYYPLALTQEEMQVFEENNQVRKKEVMSVDYSLALTPEEMQILSDEGLSHEEIASLAGVTYASIISSLIRHPPPQVRKSITPNLIRLMYDLHVRGHTYEQIAINTGQPKIRVEYYLENMSQEIKNYLDTAPPTQLLDIRKRIQNAVCDAVVAEREKPKM